MVKKVSSGMADDMMMTTGREDGAYRMTYDINKGVLIVESTKKSVILKNMIRHKKKNMVLFCCNGYYA